MSDTASRPARLHQFKLQTSIGTLVGLLVAALSGVLVFLEYREARALALSYAEARFGQSVLDARDHLRTILGPTGQVLHGFIDAVDADPTHLVDSDGQSAALLAAALRSEHIERLVSADLAGNFWLAEDLGEDKINGEPEGAEFALHVRRQGIVGPVETRSYFDAELRPLGLPQPLLSELDFLSEPWFADAAAAEGLVPGDPEAVPDGHGLAAVVALYSPRQERVVAAYVAVRDLTEVLAEDPTTPSTLRLLVGPRAEVIAASDATIPSGVSLGASDRPVLAALADAGIAGVAEGGSALLRVDGRDWLAWTRPVATPFSQPVRLAVLSPRDEILTEVMRALWRNMALSGALALVGLFVAGLISRSISRPIQALTREAARLETLDFQPDFAFSSRIVEVSRLAQTLRVSEEALQGFTRYVPGELVRRIVAGELKPELGGERRSVTILFSDIAGFTTLSEGIEPEALTKALTEYLSEIGTALTRGGATIDKYIGDAVMAFWNAPADQPDHARLACLAALRAAKASRAMAEAAAREGRAAFPTRFGLHLGEAVIGNIGSADRMNYTALGAAVNLASRIEGLNKHFGTDILISEAVRQAAGEGFITRPAGLVVAKGAIEPVLLHTLVGTDGLDPATDASAAEREAAIAWRAPFEAYRAGLWGHAVQELEQFLEAHGPDGLAERTLARALIHRAAPVPDWDGVEHMTEK